MEFELATESPSRLAMHGLQADRLVITPLKGKQEEILFADIRAISLQQTMGVYRMRITRASGGAVMVRSRYLRPGGLANFDDRVDQYGALVRGLHEATKAHHDNIRFIGGSTAFYWFGWAMLPNAALLLSIALYAQADGENARWARMLFLLAPLSFVVGIAAIRQGRGKAYTPCALPAKLVGS